MKQDLRTEVEKMAEFCGRTLSSTELDKITEHCQFESMKENPMTNFSVASYIYDFSKAVFMRSGTAGGWKKYFSEEQSSYIDAVCKEKLEPTGLHLQFELDKNKMS